VAYRMEPLLITWSDRESHFNFLKLF